VAAPPPPPTSPCGCAPGDLQCNISCSANAPPFNKEAARSRIAAVQPTLIAACPQGWDDPSGVGHVTLTFEPTGSLSSVVIDPPYAGTPMGTCIANKFRTVTVPAFSGDKPVTVSTPFTR
jgi:hypothetical protein